MQYQVLENFKKHYSRKSKNTLDSYVATVKKYYEFVESEMGWSSESDVITNSDWSSVNLFVNHMIDKELSPYTVNQRISALKTYFKFLRLQHLITVNPVEEVELVGTESVEQKTDYLTINEYKKLLEVITTPTGGKQDCFEFTSSRDVFMVGLMLTTGLRISEVLEMKVDQIDIENKRVKVLGKGKKLRSVPVTNEVLQLMTNYLQTRRQLKQIVDNDVLFLSKTGKKMSRQNTNSNIKKYCKRAGIEKDIHNHSLRHTALSTMAESGMSMVKVQAIAGHESVTTTNRYVHVTTDDVEEFMPKLF